MKRFMPVVRRGDVIPFAGRSLPERRDGGEVEIVPPGHCVIIGAFTDPRSGAEISRPDVTRPVEQVAATTSSSVSATTAYPLAGDNVGAPT
ncbi:hypothetical protein AB0C21_05335 [Spirillospora sp. NPDC049024]